MAESSAAWLWPLVTWYTCCVTCWLTPYRCRGTWDGRKGVPRPLKSRLHKGTPGEVTEGRLWSFLCCLRDDSTCHCSFSEELGTVGSAFSFAFLFLCFSLVSLLNSFSTGRMHGSTTGTISWYPFWNELNMMESVDHQKGHSIFLICEPGAIS